MRRLDKSKHFAHALRQLWRKARRNYRVAGQPFGRSNRALDIWIMYGQITTSN
jgi:hypothetical protein